MRIKKIIIFSIIFQVENRTEIVQKEKDEEKSI